MEEFVSQYGSGQNDQHRQAMKQAQFLDASQRNVEPHQRDRPNDHDQNKKEYDKRHVDCRRNSSAKLDTSKSIVLNIETGLARRPYALQPGGLGEPSNFNSGVNICSR